MFFVDQLILYGSLLIILGILFLKVSSRYGVPALVLFMFVGMLAGSEGIGGIVFNNYEIAHGIGTIALVVILFDGGLRTETGSLKLTWKPSIIMATLGVFVTAIITGLVAMWTLDLAPMEGLLLGSIVGSTDAAAVFFILRSQGVNIKPRLQSTLEVESGSNDPMAIFLTVGMIEVMLGQRTMGLGLLSLFVIQMGVGLAVGFLLGKGTAWLINRINLDAAGVYPVLVLTLGMFTYGLAASIGGSGYLAVYVAGIVLGNSPIVFKRGTFLFHDGIAWISQIVMFVVMGLLSSPSALIDVAWGGMIVAIGLTFFARPAAVMLCLWPFKFNLRELTLISWVGLKGAVPIILATFPLLFGLPSGQIYFNVIFFVVIVSVLTQGWTLPTVARWLRLERPVGPSAPVTLDLTSLRHVEADAVDYLITERSAVAHLRISELSLPEDMVVAMVTRGNEIIPVRGATTLLPGDHVFVILRPSIRDSVDEVFRTMPEPQTEVPLRTGVLLPGNIRLRELNLLYGVEIEGNVDETLADFMERNLNHHLSEGSFVEFSGWRFYVHSNKNDVPVIGLEEITST